MSEKLDQVRAGVSRAPDGHLFTIQWALLPTVFLLLCPPISSDQASAERPVGTFSRSGGHYCPLFICFCAHRSSQNRRQQGIRQAPFPDPVGTFAYYFFVAIVQSCVWRGIVYEPEASVKAGAAEDEKGTVLLSSFIREDGRMTAPVFHLPRCLQQP